MAVTRFRPEIWSAELLVSLQKQLVYAGPAVVNRDWEGEISQAGDTVRISSIGRPTIGTYVPNSTDISYEELTDAQRVLVIDQAKYFSFQLDDVDAVQAAGNVLTPAMEEAGYGLADVADQYVASLYTQANSANALGTVTVNTGDLAYQQLVNLGTKLDEANVPSASRYAVIPPWYHALLLVNPNFINAEKSADQGRALRAGEIGEAAGFRLYKSNNAPNPTGDDFVVMAGVPAAITFADQISKTEALRLEKRFGDGVRGLHLYGSKMIRPEAVATLVASKT
jgi:N4-gp56 family major capsid protein